MNTKYTYRRLSKDNAAVLLIDHQSGLVNLVQCRTTRRTSSRTTSSHWPTSPNTSSCRPSWQPALKTVPMVQSYRNLRKSTQKLSTFHGLASSSNFSVSYTRANAGRNSDASYIGNQPSVQVEWRIDRHVTLTTVYAHFFSGEFLKESGPGKDVDYFSTRMTYKFWGLRELWKLFSIVCEFAVKNHALIHPSDSTQCVDIISKNQIVS